MFLTMTKIEWRSKPCQPVGDWVGQAITMHKINRGDDSQLWRLNFDVICEELQLWKIVIFYVQDSDHREGVRFDFKGNLILDTGMLDCFDPFQDCFCFQAVDILFSLDYKQSKDPFESCTTQPISLTPVMLNQTASEFSFQALVFGFVQIAWLVWLLSLSGFRIFR